MKQFNWALNLSGRLIRNPLFALEIIYNIICERIRGIETYKKVISNDLGIPMELMPVDYAGSGNSYLGRVLKDLRITNNDSIIDLGCGKGGALLYMTKFPFNKIAGIEYSHAVFLKAEYNLQKMKQNQIQLIHGDAGSFTGFDGFNYVYMFNPFGSVTMSRVMDRISESYSKYPRDIYIIYKNPECHLEVVKNGIFKKTAEYKSEWKQFRFFVYKTNADI